MRKGLSFAAAFLAVILAAPHVGRASDHLDGVKTTVDHAADLTDVYSFLSPTDSQKLVLVLNVNTAAHGATRFSDAVDYKIRVRPIVDAQKLLPSQDASAERSVTCNFSGGLILIDPKQQAVCKVDLGGGHVETVSFPTRSANFRAGGVGEQNGIRIFAGLRSDTWFIDLAKTIAYNEGHSLPTPPVNGIWGQNVLSIVVEIDKARFPGPLLAVAAQTVRK